MHFRKSYICSNKLDVQETKHQFLTVQQNLKIFSLDTGLRLDGLPALELWDLICFCLWKYFSCFRSNGETCEWEKQNLSCA